MAAYDLVLHGATGFVGQLVVDYLARHPQGDRFSWAIAGRNPEKLAGIRATAASLGSEPGVIVAQAADQGFDVFCDRLADDLQQVYRHRKAIVPTKRYNWSSHDVADAVIVLQRIGGSRYVTLP